MAPAASATSPDDRIHLLDALRGFALFGIFFANIQDWSTWGWMGREAQVALAGETVTRVVNFTHLILVDGKFYTIFSFLFGMGFALQLSRLEGRGEDGRAIYRRRLALLLLIGLAHLSLLWAGDILTLYALLGFTLPLFRHLPDRRLLTLAAALILLPIPGYAVFAALGVPPDLGMQGVAIGLGDHLFTAWTGETPPPELEWFARGDWAAYWSWTLSGPPWRLGALLESWRFPKVLGIMLLGLWAGRHLVAGTLLADRRRLARVAGWGLLVGLPANAAYAAMGGLWQEDAWRGLATTTLYALGVVPLGLAYAALFALAWRRASRWLGVLAAPGRMALTNYLGQTLIGMAIFQGIGLGLAGQVGPGVVFATAAAVLALQVAASNAWLRRYRQGPMEWAWRKGTYAGRARA